LPYGPGKAAIVIMSAADLKLGSDAELVANGVYDTTGTVDDRLGIKFLDSPADIPLPGAYPRNQGVPFDLAIYVASTTGDVDVSAPVSIMSNGETPAGAMIVDAYDTVTFDGKVPGGLFETSLANGNVGDRLEVCSRITEWLDDVGTRLPYPFGGGPFTTGYNYVLRGAGLENPEITDERAWVLKSKNRPSEAAPLPQFVEPKIEGCPVMMDAVAMELGITSETIQVSINSALAASPGIQPCDACARFTQYARILKDPDGTRMAAMAQVFNEIAPPDRPPTDEMFASITTAFSQRLENADMPQYASAMEFIDAFVGYVAVLDELGSPVGDSVAFVMEKYGATITENPNPNIAAYIQTRLANIGK
jgi:hypothetical protein